MYIYIKNMVSCRCKIIVQNECESLGINYKSINLGILESEDYITEQQTYLLQKGLLKWGLELLTDKKNILVERIKNIIIEMIHYTVDLPVEKYSTYISLKMGYNYSYMANLFIRIKGTTIEQFIIQHKIEKAKELISYGGLSLTDISYILHYSSVAHLSSQFKKITGQTPSLFKKTNPQKRKNLESI